MSENVEQDFFGTGLATVQDENDLGEVSTAGVLKTQGKYTTSANVVNPRNSNTIALRLKDESRRSGESFYYGWGSGKNRVEGPSIKLAQAAARCYGNCAIEMGEVQNSEDAWIFTAYFVDLETGFTYGRQFRQSKNWAIHGRFDQDRKDDMRFAIGQSKAIRNVILNVIPEWIISGAIEEAKAGVREKVLQFINKMGINKAQEMMIDKLSAHGVTELSILQKCRVASSEGLDAEMIVMLRGDLYALDNGVDMANNLFPTVTASKKVTKRSKSSLGDKLKADDVAPAPVEGDKQAPKG